MHFALDVAEKGRVKEHNRLIKGSQRLLSGATSLMCAAHGNRFEKFLHAHHLRDDSADAAGVGMSVHALERQPAKAVVERRGQAPTPPETLRPRKVRVFQPRLQRD